MSVSNIIERMHEWIFKNKFRIGQTWCIEQFVECVGCPGASILSFSGLARLVHSLQTRHGGYMWVQNASYCDYFCLICFVYSKAQIAQQHSIFWPANYDEKDTILMTLIILAKKRCAMNGPKLTASPAQVTNDIPGILLVILSCVLVTGNCQLS